jgi:hypothetical protein
MSLKKCFLLIVGCLMIAASAFCGGDNADYVYPDVKVSLKWPGNEPSMSVYGFVSLFDADEYAENIGYAKKSIKIDTLNRQLSDMDLVFPGVQGEFVVEVQLYSCAYVDKPNMSEVPLTYVGKSEVKAQGAIKKKNVVNAVVELEQIYGGYSPSSPLYLKSSKGGMELSCNDTGHYWITWTDPATLPASNDEPDWSRFYILSQGTWRKEGDTYYFREYQYKTLYVGQFNQDIGMCTSTFNYICLNLEDEAAGGYIFPDFHAGNGRWSDEPKEISFTLGKNTKSVKFKSADGTEYTFDVDKKGSKSASKKK